MTADLGDGTLEARERELAEMESELDRTREELQKLRGELRQEIQAFEERADDYRRKSEEETVPEIGSVLFAKGVAYRHVAGRLEGLLVETVGEGS